MTDSGVGTAADFTLGVIEGFFGTPWSWEDRTAYAGFLAAHGFAAYCYAPKADPWLRREWHTPFPDHQMKQLSDLRRHYRQHGVSFGIGLSPFALYEDFSSARVRQLQNKLTMLDAIEPDFLCILFDDMPGATWDLAPRQCEIMDFVMAHSRAAHFVLCPTYYSDDPALDKYFGPRPSGYLNELGSRLPKTVDIFWTGPKVVSPDYPAGHLQQVAEMLQRNPLIWDNYPVNDSKSMAPFLHLEPLQRGAAVNRENCRGLLANPMNQAWLSQLPLAALAGQYKETLVRESYSESVRRLCGDTLGKLILEDMDTFQKRGLEHLDDNGKQALAQRYGALPGNPFAREILDWLAGRYEFDPACLTE